MSDDAEELLRKAIEWGEKIGVCDKIFRMAYVRECLHVGAETQETRYWKARFYARKWHTGKTQEEAIVSAATEYIEYCKEVYNF